MEVETDIVLECRPRSPLKDRPGRPLSRWQDESPWTGPRSPRGTTHPKHTAVGARLELGNDEPDTHSQTLPQKLQKSLG